AGNEGGWLRSGGFQPPVVSVPASVRKVVSFVKSEVKKVLTLSFTTPTKAPATTAANRPYSSAVTPSSSFRKLRMAAFMTVDSFYLSNTTLSRGMIRRLRGDHPPVSHAVRHGPWHQLPTR